MKAVIRRADDAHRPEKFDVRLSQQGLRTQAAGVRARFNDTLPKCEAPPKKDDRRGQATTNGP
jgi:hypothetical protein